MACTDPEVLEVGGWSSCSCDCPQGKGAKHWKKLILTDTQIQRTHTQAVVDRTMQGLIRADKVANHLPFL